ncbi:hypothetical protein HBB16_16800 [Pseudonocardia sp. MCCB 268]|nr:hypothetical protein [Pseudonocardia cytotoxica]
MAAPPLLQTLTGTARTAYELAAAPFALPSPWLALGRAAGRPGKLVGISRARCALLQHLAAYAVGAARHSTGSAVVDDDGVTTYAELDERTDLVRRCSTWAGWVPRSVHPVPTHAPIAR